MREPPSQELGTRPPEEGSYPDVYTHCSRPRFREEIFSELGRLLWSSFTFLWCYVTLPGLLALLAVCLIQLHQRVPSYYTAWNSSVVRSPTATPGAA